jgi:hypothetical protein
VGLELVPLSLFNTIEELLERKSSDSGLENWHYCCRGFAALTTRHPSIRKKLALTSLKSGGLSVGIVSALVPFTSSSSCLVEDRRCVPKTRMSFSFWQFSHFNNFLLARRLRQDILFSPQVYLLIPIEYSSTFRLI